MRRRSVLAGLVISLAFVLIGCEDPAPSDDAVETEPDTDVVRRGERLLGVAISDRADGDFGAAYTQAVAAGMQVTSVSLQWDELETAPGKYAPDPDFLAILAAFYAERETRIVLEINPIDTTKRRVPKHLADRAWDDPKLIAAFGSLLEWALPKVREVDLVTLSIGNEIDIHLKTDAEWAAYGRFWSSAAKRARALRPGIRVGTKITVDGLSRNATAQAATMVAKTDLVLTTYYPLDDLFHVRPNASVRETFDDVVERFPEQQILFVEAGCPSSEKCKSSEAHQAEFVGAVFAAWDAHPEQIELVEFTWMHDISADALKGYETYYGVSQPGFLGFLASLGLKSHAGADKPGWARLVTEAERRGW